MKKILFGIITFITLSTASFGFARFEDVLTDSTQDISTNVDRANIANGQEGEGAKALVLYIASKIIFPLAIIIGILLCIIGFYKLFFANASDKQSDSTKYVLRSVVGVLIAVSAGYFGTTLVGDYGSSGIINGGTAINGVNLANDIYDKIAFPFLKFAMFLIIGILFIVLVVHFIKFIWGSGSEDTVGHAKKIIIWNTIGILVILSAEKLVSAIYGVRSDLKDTSKLSDVGSGLLKRKNFAFLYTIINWLLGLIAFLILVFVIYQAFLLLTKPDDQETMKKLTRSFIYIFIGIVMIGAAYLLTNFVIIGWI